MCGHFGKLDLTPYVLFDFHDLEAAPSARIGQRSLRTMYLARKRLVSKEEGIKSKIEWRQTVRLLVRGREPRSAGMGLCSLELFWFLRHRLFVFFGFISNSDPTTEGSRCFSRGCAPREPQKLKGIGPPCYRRRPPIPRSIRRASETGRATK